MFRQKPFVHVVYEKYADLGSYKKAIWKRFVSKDVDFIDGIIHSPTKCVLSLGNFVDEAPYTHHYNWMRVYYKSTKEREEDYLRTPDYFFRYDKGVTNVTPRSFLGRLFFGKFVSSNEMLQIAKKFRKIIPSKKIPITIDTFIPFSQLTNFMEWYGKEVDFFPLWCVPYKIVRHYEWLADDFVGKMKDELFVDIAVYGMENKGDRNYYKMFEDKLMEIGGIKTLISGNHYTEDDFWKTWNKENYAAVKAKTDPNNIFRDLYVKTCKTMMGVEDVC